MIWIKQQALYERKAYRIVQKYISELLRTLPIGANMYNYEQLINDHIHRETIEKMYKELYSNIGLDYGKKVNLTLERTKKANSLFNTYLLKQILLFLSNEGGVKITSVRDTLVKDIIESIKSALGENGTVIDLRNAIQDIIEKSQVFYKWQSLRIARTETTAASGLAAFKTAENSDLVMQKEWVSVIDNRTRFDHRIENGQIVDLEAPFIMASGSALQYPGDMNAPANEVINCRCTIGFIPKRDADGMLILKSNL